MSNHLLLLAIEQLSEEELIHALELVKKKKAPKEINAESRRRNEVKEVLDELLEENPLT